MTHYKRRHAKRTRGCCSMCACRGHDMGVRNKRLETIQELRAPTVAEFAEPAMSEPVPEDFPLQDEYCQARGTRPCLGA